MSLDGKLRSAVLRVDICVSGIAAMSLDEKLRSAVLRLNI